MCIKVVIVLHLRSVNMKRIRLEECSRDMTHHPLRKPIAVYSISLLSVILLYVECQYLE